jgi:hypothetical protein
MSGSRAERRDVRTGVPGIYKRGDGTFSARYRDA